MRTKKMLVLLIILLIVGGIGAFYTYYRVAFSWNSQVESTTETFPKGESIKLPEPKLKGDISVEAALSKRRSVREYSNKPLSLGDVSQLLWAAQGITDPSSGGRTAPSAGATYPMEIYMSVRSAENLKSGIYWYNVKDHSIVLYKEGDFSKQLEEACLGQSIIGNSSINIILTAVFQRTAKRYGDRGEQYVYVEAGHIGQNIYLQAESLNLGTVMSGAFTDKMVKEVLSLPKAHVPLAVMPVGKKQ